MTDRIWRVEWNLAGQEGPHQTLEFSSESSATGWAEGLLNHCANRIVVTELIVGRTIYFNDSSPLFEK